MSTTILNLNVNARGLNAAANVPVRGLVGACRPHACPGSMSWDSGAYASDMGAKPQGRKALRGFAEQPGFERPALSRASRPSQPALAIARPHV